MGNYLRIVLLFFNFIVWSYASLVKLTNSNDINRIKENYDIKDYFKLDNSIGNKKGILESLEKILLNSKYQGLISKLFENSNHTKNKFLGEKSIAFSYSQKIIRAGFQFEEHKILTKDGYINTIWRIPGKLGDKTKEKKQPIILQHGLLDDSWTFFAFKPKFCLPFILAELGYDVWIPNTRGNIFSSENIDPNKNSKKINSEYWNFSLDEISKFDFPANVDFVLNETKFDKLYYVGHSQGTMQYFMNYMLDSSFIKQRISKFIAVGTVPTIYNQYSPLVKLLSKINIFKLLDILNIRNFLELNPFSDEIIHFFCTKAKFICGRIIEAIVETKVTNRTDFNKILDLFYYEPGGSSIKNLLHWIQIYHNQDLAFYDYGKEKNIRLYGQPKPPSYNMSNFNDYSVPSLITRSDSDPFSSLKDVDLWLNYAKYQDKKDIIKILELHNYNHLDYLWSEDAFEDIFKNIVEFLNES